MAEDRFLLADGTSNYLLADGTSVLLMTSTSADPADDALIDYQSPSQTVSSQSLSMAVTYTSRTAT